MELPKQIETTEFTAAVWTRIVSPDGSKCMLFEAGQTLKVPKDMYGVAMQAGLIPEKPENVSVQVEAEAKPRKKQSQEAMVMEGLVEACRTLIVRGNPQDFTLVGLPRSSSVKKLVDFEFTKKDVERAFEQAMHEVEQDGDDSTEHSEPSSVDTA